MPLKKKYLELVKRYLFFLFIMFMSYSIFILIYFKDIIVSIFLIFISLFYLFLIRIESKTKIFIKFVKLFNILSFVLLNLIISYFYLYTHKHAGVEYFYLCLIFSIPLFFNFKKDFFSVLSISFIICMSFTICLFFDCEFVATSRFFKNQNDFKFLKLINFFFLFATFFIDILFIAQKDLLISNLIESSISIESTVELLKITNKKLNSQLNSFTIKEDDFQNVYNLAKNNSPIFMDKFNTLFPGFKSDLLNLCPSLIDSDIHFCALMKLGFDGKEISLYTNCSVKAVDSKKYRIRKKLEIPSNKNFKEFFSEFQNINSLSLAE